MELDYYEITPPSKRQGGPFQRNSDGPSGQWKVVWSNGDERYVEADSFDSAIQLAWRIHGDSAAAIIYCRRYW